MPCWETKIQAVEFRTAQKELFLKTIESLNLQFMETTWDRKKVWLISKDKPNILDGDQIVVWPDEGKARVKEQEASIYVPIMGNMRRMYSLFAVQKAAAISGFTMKNKKVKGENVMVLKKGAF